MHRVYDHAGAETFSQVTNDSMLTSGPVTPLAPRRYFSFRGSIPGPHVPLSTLRAHGYPNARMTRGQHGLLLLYCKRLSLSVTHRFTPAHRRSKRPVAFSRISKQRRCRDYVLTDAGWDSQFRRGDGPQPTPDNEFRCRLRSSRPEPVGVGLRAQVIVS